MSLKTIVRSGLRALGLDIHRYDPTVYSSPLNNSFKKFGIDLVLDVGANRGQFVLDIRSGGYRGQVVSFEPLSDAHSKLLEASTDDSAWEVYTRCALGDHNGETEINIAGNSLSSSILPMLDAHRTAAPESIYVGREIVQVKTLDTVAAPYLQSASAPFLKIDTQGYESQVLDGAGVTLPLVKGVLVELSLLPLYEGHLLWVDMIERLEAAGFVLWAFDPVFSDPRDGRTLQIDGVFYRA
jgi:FkbM family methyltransferase